MDLIHYTFNEKNFNIAKKMRYNNFAKNTAFSVLFCLHKACIDSGPVFNPGCPGKISVRFYL